MAPNNLSSFNNKYLSFKTHLFYGLQQIFFMRSIGWDTSMATKLERGHENTNCILILFCEAVPVIMQHLIQIQGELWPMLEEREKP